MYAEHEQHALADVRERLRERFPELHPDVFDAAVQVCHAELTESPIRDFVPILVEHAARDPLAFAQRKRNVADALRSPSTAPPREHDDEP